MYHFCIDYILKSHVKLQCLYIELNIKFDLIYLNMIIQKF